MFVVGLVAIAVFGMYSTRGMGERSYSKSWAEEEYDRGKTSEESWKSTEKTIENILIGKHFRCKSLYFDIRTIPIKFLERIVEKNLDIGIDFRDVSKALKYRKDPSKNFPPSKYLLKSYVARINLVHSSLEELQKVYLIFKSEEFSKEVYALFQEKYNSIKEKMDK